MKSKNHVELSAIVKKYIPEGTGVKVELDENFTVNKEHWLDGHYGTGFGCDGVWGLQLY